MIVFLISFFIIFIMIFLMSIGYWFQGKKISGSCGGLNQLDGQNDDGSCQICGKEESEVCRIKKD